LHEESTLKLFIETSKLPMFYWIETLTQRFLTLVWPSLMKRTIPTSAPELLEQCELPFSLNMESLKLRNKQYNEIFAQFSIWPPSRIKNYRNCLAANYVGMTTSVLNLQVAKPMKCSSSLPTIIFCIFDIMKLPLNSSSLIDCIFAC
jgi:hypothetical protein